ncbi:IucA/IucC family protein [Halobacillus litoralis]|uniref:IucA/IucC family protein n=1 Tax=Halobacillus litoralis TaxID=45668 RepID=UPI001CFD5CFA|nr:IucA/IucC family protein [Halobacillus litoralis]
MKELNSISFYDNYEMYLKEHLHLLKKAETVILHQLVQAVVRERVIEWEWSKGKREIVLRPGTEETIRVPVGRMYLLGHIDIQGDILWVDRKQRSQIISEPADFLTAVYPPGSRNSYQSAFLKEIVNSVHNYALALMAVEKRVPALKAEAGKTNDVWSYVKMKKEADRAFSPLTFFEQWVIQGHTIHPCARTRLGLSPKEVFRYAPEWEGQPDVIPLAVHKEVYQRTSMDNRTLKSILFKEYPELEASFQLVLQNRGLDEDDYDIIPVHPWQFQHTVQTKYEEELKRGTIIPIEGSFIKMAALISFRTLAPLKDTQKHHIKTAVNIQMTSAVRTVSAASTKNGPTLSKLFQRIISNDANLASKLTMMSEAAGIHYEPKEFVPEEERHFLQKNVAAIIRENPERNLGVDEIAVPAAVLVADSPLTGKLISQEMMEVQPDGSPELFIRQYAEALLPGMLMLISKYGISMEAHLQNCVVIFRNGRPERVVLRDNGGIRILNERLDRFFESQPIDPSTNLLTDDHEELLAVFSHAVLHNHLGEIIVSLSRRLNLDEETLWAEVQAVIREFYDNLIEEKDYVKEAERDVSTLFTNHLKMKSLVRMRLSDQYTDNQYVTTPNPFVDQKGVHYP